MFDTFIFDWAERTPEKAAIVADGAPLTYRGFADRIAAARGWLARRGCVGAGTAAVVTWGLLDFWVISLALRSLGLTTIAAQSPEAVGGLGLPDLRFVVATAGAVPPALEAICTTQNLPLLAMPADGDGEAPLGPGLLPPPDGPGGHILQTSGTTGAYKKVLMDPSFEADYMRKRLVVSRVTQDSVVNLFDFGGWTGGGYKSGVSAWMVGATTIFDQRPQRHLSLLYPGITLSLMVPTMLDAVLAAPEGAFPRSETMWLSVTGGTLTQAQIDAAKARITPHLFSGLGATETHSFGFTPLNTPDDHRWHIVVPGVEVQVVDEFDRPVPVGQTGRVRVGTEGGPARYLHDEEATRAFFKDGFFYPGDLGVIRQDGRLALQGRTTNVINVGGHKVSPEPIEHRLRDGLGVRDVCLFSMQDDAGEEQLHVIIETPAALPLDRLTAVLRGELRGFPHAEVHYLTALPRNDMGKVLRLEAREHALRRWRRTAP